MRDGLSQVKHVQTVPGWFRFERDFLQELVSGLCDGRVWQVDFGDPKRAVGGYGGEEAGSFACARHGAPLQSSNVIPNCA